MHTAAHSQQCRLWARPLCTAQCHAKAVLWLVVVKGTRGRLLPDSQEQGHIHRHAHVPTRVGTPVNLKAVVACTFCNALNDCNVQKQWRIKPPQKPLYKVSLSANWPLSQAGDMFSPSNGDFSFRSRLPPALFFSFAHAHCIIRAQTTRKTSLLRLSHWGFVQFTDTARIHMVFLFP